MGSFVIQSYTTAELRRQIRYTFGISIICARSDEAGTKMLIEFFIPNPDAVETHKIEIAASREAVYQALWTTDLGGSPVIKGLMALRSLPGLLLRPGRIR